MSEKLVEFLYLLGRDELPLGVIESLLNKIQTTNIHENKKVIYNNRFLQKWAISIAKRLGD